MSPIEFLLLNSFY